MSDVLIRATELRTAGVSWSAIASETGVPRRTLRRWLDPSQRKSSLRASRDAKRRRHGVCVDCGGQTRYGGRTGQPAVSERCRPCEDRAKRVYSHDEIIRLRRMALSQAEIAQRVGCSQAHVSHVLRMNGMGVGKGSRAAIRLAKVPS